MGLTAEQKDRFMRDGFLRLPGAVPRALVDEALRGINAALGGGRPEYCAGNDPDPRISARIEALLSRPVILDLFGRSAVKPAAEHLLGGRATPAKRGWLVLRYPTARGRTPEPLCPHVDGVGTGSNYLRAGKVLPKTLSVMVYLSDVPGPDCGNFTVYPGSHIRLAAHLRRRGWRVLKRGMPKIPLGRPLPIEGRAGDAVLSHQLLSHSGGPNLSPHIRYAAFFHLDHVEHDRLWERSLTDVRLEYPGARRG